MADSTGHTKEQVIGDISKEMLLELYTTDDVKRDYTNLRKRLDDPATSNKDFARLLTIIWNFTVSKPAQGINMSSNGDKIDGIRIEIVNPKEGTDGTLPQTN